MPCGLGAKSAVNSTLPVPTRNNAQFSQVQPPCMEVLTMPLGNAVIGRGSIAHNKIVWVPPPLPPVTAMRLGSTSGRLARKSRQRIEFQV